MTKDLVIFGTSSFAQIAKHYFERDTEFRPIAFTVDEKYCEQDAFEGLPLIPFENVRKLRGSARTYFHVAATYTHLNRLRQRKVLEMEAMGFSPASYVSPSAYIDSSAALGTHQFIFENNVVQPYVRLGDRVILWSGNHIGHHSVIGDDVFVSSHVVVSGHCRIGPRSFLGVNCSVGNGVTIGEDNWILPNTPLLKSTENNQMWRPAHAILSSVSPRERFGESRGS